MSILSIHMVAVRLGSCFKGTEIPFVVVDLIVLGVTVSVGKKDEDDVRRLLLMHFNWWTSNT